MAKLFLIPLIFMILFPIAAQRNVPSVQLIDFSYKSNKKDLFSYNDYLRSLERRVSRLIRTPKQQIPLKIVAVGDFPQGFRESDIPNTYLLTDNRERLYYDYALNMKLIETVLLARCGLRPDQLRQPYPRWVITAIYNKIHPEQAHVVPLPKRPGLYAFAAAGEFPQVENALLNPIVFTEDGAAAYFLFEELCALILDISETVDLSGADYWQMAMLCRNGSPPNEVLVNTLQKRFAAQIADPRLNNSQKMQLYLENTGRERLVNPLQPLNAAQTARLVNGLRTFKYQIPDGDKMLDCEEKLERLPYVLERAANREALVKELTSRLNDLAGKSFYLVSEELRGMSRIVVEANIGTVASPRTLSDRMRRHFEDLDAALERQRRIEVRLQELEARHLSPADYYKNELNEIRSFKPAFPEAERLLDKYEKELREFH